MERLIILLLLTGCSSINKSKLYSGIAGSLLGSFVGSEIAKKTSPNKESENTNQLIGMAIGGSVGYYVGSKAGERFFKEDPENFKGEPIQIENQTPVIENTNELNLSHLKINPKIKYKLPTSELPSDLKGEVMEQGTADEIFHNPSHDYTKKLIAASFDLDEPSEAA